MSLDLIINFLSKLTYASYRGTFVKLISGNLSKYNSLIILLLLIRTRFASELRHKISGLMSRKCFRKVRIYRALLFFRCVSIILVAYSFLSSNLESRRLQYYFKGIIKKLELYITYSKPCA